MDGRVTVINFSREKGQSPAFARKSMRFDSGMQGYLAIILIEVAQCADN